MAFTPRKLNDTDINNGNLYVDNQDSPQADAFNRIIEGVLYNNENSGSNIIIDTELSPTSTNPVQNQAIFAKFNEIEEALYKPIDITSFTVSPSSAEKGSTVTSVTLSWVVNKTPTELILDDATTIDKTLTSKTLTGLSLSATKRYKLVATDEKGADDTVYAYINFYNGVYYGVATEPTSYDSSFILGLEKSLQRNKTITFTVTAGEGQYIYYALPSNDDYGNPNTPNFNVGGFDGGFEKVSTISFTNATNNHTENYDIYRSENANLGYTTVKVS